MKKILILSECSQSRAELLFSNFIENHKDHNITDIQYRPTSNEYGTVKHNILIVYEE